VSHFWDAEEPKLLACETKRLRGGIGAASSTVRDRSDGDDDDDTMVIRFRLTL
jgi:hypothetical protein